MIIKTNKLKHINIFKKQEKNQLYDLIIHHSTKKVNFR